MICEFLELVRAMLASSCFSHLNTVGNSRSDAGNVTDEMDADGFITVKTKREKREIKHSNAVERNRVVSNNSKIVSRAILLKQSG
jgi:hypothetical protein